MPDYQIGGCVEEDVCVVTFGGIRGGLGIPYFEFQNTLQDIPCMHFFIRDSNQCWYQSGVQGLGDDFGEVAQSIKAIIQQKRTIFLGNSMGGYAALVFGALLGADVVLAFSPQTFLSRRMRLFYRDFRWKLEIRKMRSLKKSTALDITLDLQPKWGRARIFYPMNYRLDRRHATRLQSLPRVALEAQEAVDHELVKYMRDAGTLHAIIREEYNSLMSKAK